MDTVFSDHIVLLQTSVTQLNSLCKTLINQQDGSYTTYTTPYAMSIRKVCYENGLDFNNQDQVQAILTANQAILNDPNYISKSVKLILPKVGT
jgi:hypothetical protein